MSEGTEIIKVKGENKKGKIVPRLLILGGEGAREILGYDVKQMTGGISKPSE